MGKTADLTVVQKTTIDTLHKEGKTQKVIAKEAGCSQSSVSKHINREAHGRNHHILWGGRVLACLFLRSDPRLNLKQISGGGLTFGPPQYLYHGYALGEAKGRKRCGRKKCTSNRDNRTLERIVKQNPFKNVGEIHKEWTAAGVSASRTTTHRRMQDMGFSCR